jgi:hypothetical protein
MLESLVVIAKKSDANMKLVSPQFDRQQETVVEGTPVIVAAGGTIAAGQPIALTLSGLPHHSTVARTTALTLASLIVIVGVWTASGREDPSTRDSERKRLIARREKLFQDLVRLEHDHRRGRPDAARYAARRDDLMAALEHIYGALDADDAGPDPLGRTGIGASVGPSGVREPDPRSEARGTTDPGASRATSRDDRLRAS